MLRRLLFAVFVVLTPPFFAVATEKRNLARKPTERLLERAQCWWPRCRFEVALREIEPKQLTLFAFGLEYLQVLQQRRMR